uniref:Uncharacterized protein n=1 Tax=Aureoumbra lagunensis TaxID=44058 RepID=A0A7S3JPZ2_9STRA|mmetsp:Transcript_13749/g.18339  ORF Transcript_13749/g.18339 Transcript_13749/m.18339 type:complete len:160 (+) Transcript_13749:123-602(+)
MAAIVDQPKELENLIINTSVRETFRQGGTVEAEVAEAYANAIEFDRSNYNGCYCIKWSRCCNIPIACSYNFHIGKNCFCVPAFFLCIPLLFCSLNCCCDQIPNCLATPENAVYTIVMRFAKCHLVLVDDERKTLAAYPVCGCSEEAESQACCVCHRLCL